MYNKFQYESSPEQEVSHAYRLGGLFHASSKEGSTDFAWSARKRENHVRQTDQAISRKPRPRGSYPLNRRFFHRRSRTLRLRSLQTQ